MTPQSIEQRIAEKCAATCIMKPVGMSRDYDDAYNAGIAEKSAELEPLIRAELQPVRDLLDAIYACDYPMSRSHKKRIENAATRPRAVMGE